MAILAGAFAVFNFYLVGPYQGKISVQASVTSGREQRFRAVLANVNHDKRAYDKLYGLVDSTSPDFIVLLEVNKTWMRSLQRLLSYYSYTQSRSQEKYDIVLLSRIPFEDAAVEIIGKAGLPSVIARFDIDGQRLNLIGTHPYSPTSGVRAEYRNQQLAELAKFVSDQEGSTVLLGDLNTTPWSPFFKDFLSSSGLRDSREGFGLQPTWPVRFLPARVPIDHCLVSSNVVVHDREIGPDIGSDHYPVVVDFSLRAESKGQREAQSAERNQ